GNGQRRSQGIKFSASSSFTRTTSKPSRKPGRRSESHHAKALINLKMSNPKKRVAESAPPPKQAKKRKTKFQHEDEALDTELGLNTLFTRMDNQLLADHLAQKITRFGGDLSSVELADLTVSANSIQDTTAWQEKRTLDNLPGFLEKFTEDPASLKKAPKKKGSPHTLIVAGAGLRAADIVRATRKFSGKDNTVAKLFAKHMKVDEQVAFLKNTKTGIGVGTPARLMELIDDGALSLDNLKRLVVDASHIDQKKRGVMDMKDTMMPLARFLVRGDFKARYADAKKPLALLFY
ncbi:Protein cms1, partial [Tolypocladium paradoxum]